MTDDAHADLRAAAELAQSFVARIAGQDGIADQIAAGDWDDRLDETGARDLAALLSVMAENVRHTRARSHLPRASAEDQLGGPLPMNRKERYYTGTVLPMLVASDGFAHLDRFLHLCGLPAVELHPGLDGGQEFQFLTEYGFAESVFTEEDRESWPGSLEADTPDIVIAGPDWLLAVEAKMFHNPNGADLEAQMSRQAVLIDLWRTRLGLRPDRVRHVLLLPSRLADRVEPVAYPVVTWEQVLDAYDVVGPRYWARLLATALSRHAVLESIHELSFGSNADDSLTGSEILEAYSRGETPFDSVGRGGGLTGSKFTHDVSSGKWRTVKYEVRSGGAPNRNWFSLTDFIAATTH